jgi:Zn-dependent protease
MGRTGRLQTMSLLNLLLDRIVLFIPVLLSLTVHEWAHAWTAWKLGDDTAKMLGRVSLNPLDHIDPVGTVLLPLLGIPFGWAKPVPINPVRFRSSIKMSTGLMLTAAAGPISNLLLAAIGCAALFGLTRFSNPELSGGIAPSNYAAAIHFVQSLVLINIVLACFNLLPIPPLDGSRIAEALMPPALRSYWNSFTALGPLLLLAVILLPTLSGFSLLTWPIRWASELMQWMMTR